MRALVYSATKKVEMQEISRPDPAAGEIVLAVELAGICGSDISGFLGHSARRVPPLVLGHELVGHTQDGRRAVVNPLISCGSCSQCLAGRQNLCATWVLLGMDKKPGACAEFVAVPERQVLFLPEEIPSQRAVLVEPLANIVHLYRLLAATPLSRLAIIGAGTMGTLALLLGKLLGFQNILVVDVNDERLNVASQLGASLTESVHSPDDAARVKKTLGNSFDVVIDASGTGAARQMALDVCVGGGQVVLLGMAEAESKIDFVTSIRKEHRITMSFAYTPRDFQRALDLLVEGQIDLAPWTSCLPLESGQAAFEQMSFNPGATLKMLLEVPHQTHTKSSWSPK
jgi:2-desacetyl-2-hydroxyethyl bacteriochlorophyllide A dehydrogenase